MDGIKSSRSSALGYHKKKSHFPVIKPIPHVDIVKKKSIKKKNVGSSSPMMKYDSDLIKEENSRMKNRNNFKPNNQMKNSFRNSQPRELKTFYIEPLTNINDFKPFPIKTYVRFRPFDSIENEMDEKHVGSSCISIINSTNVTVTNYQKSYNFTFNNVFNSESSQEEVFNSIGIGMINEFIKGFNVSLITHGHKSAGKSYTAIGDDLKYNKGFLPRAIDYIFEHMNNESKNDYELIFSAVEISEENVWDCLSKSNSDIQVKEDKKKGVFLENLTEMDIGSKEEIYLLLEQILDKKSVSSNKSNSHFIYSLKFNQRYPDETSKKSLLYIIDLAGIEKSFNREEQKQSLSLSGFSNVINYLSTNKKEFIPYKESKLTRIIKDSIGGNTKTYLVFCSSMHSLNSDEIYSCFNLAMKASMIKNVVKMNVRKNPEDLEEIIISLNDKLKQANSEIKRLHFLLTNKTSGYASPVKLRHIDTLPLSINSGNSNMPTVTNSPIKLTKNPNSFVTEGTKGIKSKSSLLDINNLDQIESVKEDLVCSNLEGKHIFNLDKENSSCLGNDLTVLRNNNISEKWREKNENLLIENKLLKEKLNKIEEAMNVVQIVERIEDSLKFSLKELQDYSYIYKDNFKQLQFQENSKLKELLESKETRFFERILKNLNSDDPKVDNTEIEGVKNLYKKFLGKLNKDEGFWKSYKAIYENMKFFSNKLLIDFLKLNSSEKDSKQSEEMIRIEKSKYENLKTSFVQSNSLVILYEKLLHDLLDKFALDFSKFKLQEKQFNSFDKLINTFNTNLANYINIFIDLKSFIYYKQEQSNRDFSYQINEENAKSKLIVNGLKNSGKSLDGFSNILKKLSSNNFYFRETEHNEFEKEKADFFELRMLRNESKMTKHHLSCLINEISLLRQRNDQLDNNLTDFQQSLYNNFKTEINSVEKEIQIYKQFYNQEILELKKTIEEMNIKFDDMLLNFNKEGKGIESLKSYYTQEFQRIFNKDDKTKSLHELAGTILSEGVASKKLDYVYIDMNRNQNVNIVFGSGINKRVPSKSPLYKNLKYSLEGDNCNDVYTPENTDY